MLRGRIAYVGGCASGARLKHRLLAISQFNLCLVETQFRNRRNGYRWRNFCHYSFLLLVIVVITRSLSVACHINRRKREVDVFFRCHTILIVNDVENVGAKTCKLILLFRSIVCGVERILAVGQTVAIKECVLLVFLPSANNLEAQSCIRC